MPACVGTTRLRAAVPALLLSLGLAACDGSSTSTEPLVERAAQSRTPQPPEDVHGPRSAADVATNVSAHSADVTVDTAVTVSVTDGTLSRVLLQAQGSSGRVAGTFDDDRTRWTADELLEPDTDYVVEGRGTDQAGLSARVRVPFRTENLTLPEQTYASIAPLEGEVVGVGMPVIVTFDVPVARRAEFERHLHISSEPATRGSWHWMSDSEVLWRPQAYWEPGTRVHVDLDVNGLDAGNGIYGQMDRSISFSVGRSVVLRADLKSHRMKVFVAGRLARTIPITGGKSGFETRSGTKLIVEKFRSKRMDAATVGIQKDDPEYYNIPRVQYAQRVTFTGEFLHAAPWSTYAQGSSNVSHGCVGMSVADAGWLYGLTHRGDPVEVTGTTRTLEPGNGWTDWDVSFAEYKQASALRG